LKTEQVGFSFLDEVIECLRATSSQAIHVP
jgi:hypothetical protein